MLKKFEISGVHTTVDAKLREYVNKKIGGLDKYLSKHNRESAHAEVHLKEGKGKNHNDCSCEVTMYLPHQTIVVKENALNMYAAVDIAEAKLKQQLQKYKGKHASSKTYRHRIARLLRKNKD